MHANLIFEKIRLYIKKRKKKVKKLQKKKIIRNIKKVTQNLLFEVAIVYKIFY